MSAKVELDWSPNASLRLRRWSFIGLPQAFRASAHPGYEFAWVSHGEADYRVGSKHIVLTPGTIAMVPSFAEHANTMRGPMRAHALVLSPELVRKVSDELGIAVPSDATLTHSDRLATLSRWVEEESAATSGAIVTDALSTLLIAETLKASAANDIRQRTSRGDPRMHRAIEYIRANTTTSLSIEALASEVGMSRFHFCRVFKQATGKSAYQFVQHERLEGARRALLAGQSVTEAALNNGFSDLSRFSKLYSRAFGALPSAARKVAVRG